MGSQQEQFLVKTADKAAAAAEGAKGRTAADSSASNRRRGVVTAVGSGSYTVSVLSASGGVAQSIAGVKAWADGALAPGDKCFVVWEPGRPVPFIEPVGGSGGGGDQVFLVTGLMFFTS
jgi:hypothetical protein